METIETDYLVVGAGAMGMAFTDTLVAETDARVVVVDRGHAPGGHWTRAYPFVRLHQPSAYYGVNSRGLGSDSIDQLGWNEGLYELATVGEICAYFDRVMQQDLLPSGQVSYFPMAEYLGDGRFRTLAGGDYTVNVRERVVDATYLQTTVPSMRPPPYELGDGVDCVPPNDLPAFAAGRDRFVIIGAGKTGIDACLWLLRNNIPPERLTWIMPRDSWLMDRANIQPGPQFLRRFQSGFTDRLIAIEAATSVADLFERLEGCGNLLRLDSATQPTMYRCATVIAGRTSTAAAHPRRRSDGTRRTHRARQGGAGRRIDTCRRFGALRRLQRRRIGTALGDNGFRWQPDHAAELARLPAGVQRRPDRPRRNHLPRRCEAQRSVRAGAPPQHRHSTGCPPRWPSNAIQIRWLDDTDMMEWLCAARLDLMRHMYAPLMDNPRVRDKVLGLIKAGLASANQKLDALRLSQTAQHRR